MNIIQADFRKGKVKLKITNLDDLWYLSQIIEAGDILRAKTTRKIRRGEKEEAVKKTITLSITTEKVEFSRYTNVLRVGGRIAEELEDIPKGSFHTLGLEEGSELWLEKKEWLDYQKKRLEEAAEKKYQYLVAIFDREEALFFLTKTLSYEKLAKLSGDVEKKEKRALSKGKFYEEVIKLLEEYLGRLNPERVILASPAFYKEDLFKLITDEKLRKKAVLATCSAVSESALDEVLKRPELKEALRFSRMREETLRVEELLSEIHRKNLGAYGLEEVKKAVEAGAAGKLLLTDSLLQEFRQKERFGELEYLMRETERRKGEVHLISTEHEAGKRLAGLGGIGALLRFKLEW